MTARALLLQRLAELDDEDVQALLVVADRLHAKPLAPKVQTANGAPAAGVRRHPERFGALVGSARFAGDIESPAEHAAAWTGDRENLRA